jgi:hypothetical protein
VITAAAVKTNGTERAICAVCSIPLKIKGGNGSSSSRHERSISLAGSGKGKKKASATERSKSAQTVLTIKGTYADKVNE